VSVYGQVWWVGGSGRGIASEAGGMSEMAPARRRRRRRKRLAPKDLLCRSLLSTTPLLHLYQPFLSPQLPFTLSSRRPSLSYASALKHNDDLTAVLSPRTSRLHDYPVPFTVPLLGPPPPLPTAADRFDRRQPFTVVYKRAVVSHTRTPPLRTPPPHAPPVH